ncbi:MAG: FecR family protein [Terriglobales bacterium]
MSITAFRRMLAVWAVLAAAFLVASASAESRARIVRLSEVQGTVQLDRTTGDGFDKAFINLPVIEGSKLKTGKDGRAEVEFEDGSTLRLAPDSEIDFAHLALGDDGQKLSTVQLMFGTVYADVRSKTYGKDKVSDQFQLNFGRESVGVPESAHFRVVFGGPNKATVAVFKGKLSASGPSGQFDVSERRGATIAFAKDVPADGDSAKPAKSDTFVADKSYDDDPSDSWDRQQTDYHDRYASASGPSIASPYGYGMSDLSYYGNFMTVPGYGNVWQPYFIGSNWNPFMAGGWAFYPGAGYMFVSGYPWGWMPYNYGAWAYAPVYGWVWQPGNWNTWNTRPMTVNAPARMIVPSAPATGHQTVMVGLGLTANPAEGAPRHLTINPDSAGFGVPRGSVNHLDRLAKTMERNPRPIVASTVQPAARRDETFPGAARQTGFGPRGTSSNFPDMAPAGTSTTHKAGVHP